MREGVRAAWRAVLEHDTFGMDHNFFDAGGHSLLLVKLREQLRLATGADVPVIDLLRHVTVQDQARLIAQVHRPAEGTAAPRQATARSRPAGTAPAAAPVPAGGRHHLLALSAVTADALTEARERLAAYLEATPDAALADVAHTLDRGRERFGHRVAVVVAGRDEAVRALRDPGTPAHAVPGPAPATVFAFPDGTGPARQVRLAERFAEHGVTPAAVYGTGTGRIAAAVLSGALAAPDAERAAAGDPVPPLRRTRLLWTTALGPVTPDDPAPREQHLTAEAEPAKLLQLARDQLGEVAVLDVPAAGLSEKALLTALAALWCRGVDARLTPAGPTRRLRLPGHPLSWARTAPAVRP